MTSLRLSAFLLFAFTGLLKAQTCPTGLFTRQANQPNYNADVPPGRCGLILWAPWYGAQNDGTTLSVANVVNASGQTVQVPKFGLGWKTQIVTENRANVRLGVTVTFFQPGGIFGNCVAGYTSSTTAIGHGPVVQYELDPLATKSTYALTACDVVGNPITTFAGGPAEIIFDVDPSLASALLPAGSATAYVELDLYSPNPASPGSKMVTWMASEPAVPLYGASPATHSYAVRQSAANAANRLGDMPYSNSSFAVLCLASQNCSISVSLTSPDGVPYDQTNLVIGPNTSLTNYMSGNPAPSYTNLLTSLFPNDFITDWWGTMTVTSPQPFAILVFQQADSAGTSLAAN